jgi:hypothetical protein
VARGRVDVAGLGAVRRERDREVSEDQPVVVADGPQPAAGSGVVMRYSGEVPAAVRPVAQGQPHLTSYRATLQPSAIADDPRLTVSGDREEFRPKIIAIEDVYLGGYVVTGVVVLLLAAGAALIVVQRRRATRAEPPTP